MYRYKYGLTEISGEKGDHDLANAIKREQFFRYGRYALFMFLVFLSNYCSNMEENKNNSSVQTKTQKTILCNSP